MLVAESQRTRRFIGRLDKGEELCGAIRAFCKEHDIRSGEVRASGLLAGVELIPYDRESKGYTTPRRLRSFFELLALQGLIATRDGELVLQLHATLSRESPDSGGGIALVGGLLMAAEVLACELVLDSFDDVTLVREFDPALGVYALTRGEPRAGAPSPVAATRALGTAPGGRGAPPPVPAGRPLITTSQPSAPAPQFQAPRAPAREPEVVRSKKLPSPPVQRTIEIPEGGAPRARGTAPLPFGGPSTSAPRPTPDHPPPAPPLSSAASGVSATDAAAVPGGSGEPSWADAVRLSAQLAAEPPRVLKPGDVLEHPKFGRCEVLRFDEGEERVSVRIPAGRLVELGLEVLHLEPVRTEGTRQVYKVHAARR